MANPQNVTSDVKYQTERPLMLTEDGTQKQDQPNNNYSANILPIPSEPPPPFTESSSHSQQFVPNNQPFQQFVPNQSSQQYVPNQSSQQFVPNQSSQQFVPNQSSQQFVPNQSSQQFVPNQSSQQFVPNQSSQQFIQSQQLPQNQYSPGQQQNAYQQVNQDQFLQKQQQGLPQVPSEAYTAPYSPTQQQTRGIPNQQPANMPQEQVIYVVQEPSPTVMVTNPMGYSTAIVSHTPVRMICPNCKNDIVTTVTENPGTTAWIIGIVICLVFWPLAWLPCVVSSFMDKTHTCPNCRTILGVVKI